MSNLPGRALQNSLWVRFGVACVAAASGLFAAAACGRDGGVADSELGELVLAPKASDLPINVEAAAHDPRELGRAVAMSHGRLAALLGPHRLTIKSSLEVKEAGSGKVVEHLMDETALQLAAEDAWHGEMNNSDDYGREIVFRDGALYLRARYQRWHQRPPTDDREAAMLRDRFYQTVAANWELLAPAIAVTDRGLASASGRPARKIAIGTSPQPSAPDREPLSHRKWRETRTLDAIEGEAMLDARSGALLQLTLHGTVGFRRDGTSYSMRIDLASEVSGVGQVPSITAPAPAEVVQTPVRLHEVDDRDKLLEGIAPPLRGADRAPDRGPTPRAKPAPSAPGSSP